MKAKLRIEEDGRYVKVTVFMDSGSGYQHAGVLRFVPMEWDVFYGTCLVIGPMLEVEDLR